MEDHLEWPDIERLRQMGWATAATRSQKRRCSRSSSVSSGWNVATMIVPGGRRDRLLPHRRDHLDVVADLDDARRADEDAGHRPARRRRACTGASNERTWRPKPLRCATMSIAASGRCSGDAVDRRGGQHDQPGAGAERRHALVEPRLQRRAQAAPVEQLVHRGRLAAGDDERRRRRLEIGRRCAPRPPRARAGARRRSAPGTHPGARARRSSPSATSRACAGAGRPGSPPSCGRPSARRGCGRRRRSASRRGSWWSPRRSRGRASTGRRT